VLFGGKVAIQLTPKAFDTLLFLVENNNHTLGKQELIETIWPDSFVEENNLAQNISILRKALGQSPEGQDYIQTVPKRGYRFAAEVKVELEEDAALVVRERTRARVVVVEEEFDEPSVPALPAANPESEFRLDRFGDAIRAQRRCEYRLPGDRRCTARSRFRDGMGFAHGILLARTIIRALPHPARLVFKTDTFRQTRHRPF